MKQKLYDFFIGGRHFKKEVKAQIRFFIIITLGFTIAFSWRQTIFDLFALIISKLFPSSSTASSTILTSTAITIFALIIIYISAHLLKDKPDYA